MYHLAESVVSTLLGKTVRLCEQPEELQRVGFTTVRCLTCLWLSILLYVVVVCILVRKLAGRCAFAKESPRCRQECDPSGDYEWSKGVERLGPRYDNLVLELPTGGNIVRATPVFSGKRRETSSSEVGGLGRRFSSKVVL